MVGIEILYNTRVRVIVTTLLLSCITLFLVILGRPSRCPHTKYSENTSLYPVVVTDSSAEKTTVCFSHIIEYYKIHNYPGIKSISLLENHTVIATSSKRSRHITLSLPDSTAAFYSLGITFQDGSQAVSPVKHVQYSLPNISRQQENDGSDYSMYEYLHAEIKNTLETRDNQFSANFSENRFFWDEQMISWMLLSEYPDAVRDTLNFWYSLQLYTGEHAGLIPREVTHQSSILSEYSAFFQTGNEEYLSIHPHTSHEVSNPFFMGRIERALYRISSDRERLREVLPYLIQYFDWVEKHRFVSNLSECDYYWWSRNGSGMDNSPRGETPESERETQYGYVDLFAQQVLLAQDISFFANELGNREVLERFAIIQREKEHALYTCYFDPETAQFYDRDSSHELARAISTSAVVWPLLTGVLSDAEFERFVALQLSDTELGGSVPLPSLARSHTEYVDSGGYWKGGAWPPHWWVLLQVFDEYNTPDLKREYADRMLEVLESVYGTSDTVYEYYAPEIQNGEYQAGDRVGCLQNCLPARDRFVGWGAIGIPLTKIHNSSL